MIPGGLRLGIIALLCQTLCFKGPGAGPNATETPHSLLWKRRPTAISRVCAIFLKNIPDSLTRTNRRACWKWLFAMNVSAQSGFAASEHPRHFVLKPPLNPTYPRLFASKKRVLWENSGFRARNSLWREGSMKENSKHAQNQMIFWNVRVLRTIWNFWFLPLFPHTLSS